MAGISQSISLKDKTTSTFNNITKAAMQTVKTYEQYEKQAEKIAKVLQQMGEAENISTKAGEELNNLYADLQDKMAEISNNGIQPVNDAQQTLNQTFIEANQALELYNKAMSVFRKLQSEASQDIAAFENQFNQEYLTAIKMHNVLGASSEEINSLYEYASALQEVGIVGDKALLAGAQELATYVDTADQLNTLLPLLADLAVYNDGLNTSAGSVTSAAGTLGRALQGTSSYLVRQGLLTEEQSDKLDALTTKAQKLSYLYPILNNKIKATNETLAKTAAGGITQANNKLGDLREQLGESLIPYLYAFESTIVQVLTPAVQWIADNMEILLPIILTLAGAVSGLAIEFAILAIAKLAASLAGNTVFLTTLKIYGAILLVIGVIYIFKSIMEKVTSQTINFIGLIVGMLYTAVAIVGNIFIFVANLVINIISTIVTTILLAINVVLGVFKAVVGVVWLLASAIDMVFGTNLAAGLGKFMDGITDVQKSLEKQMFNYDVIDYIDVGGAAAKGYELGSSFTESLNKSLGMDGIQKTLDNLTTTDAGGSAALNTTTELSDEDIQLLLDVATRDFKLNYQQVTPQVSLTFGDIHELVDIDDAMDTIADRLEEIYNSNLEVVD